MTVATPSNGLTAYFASLKQYELLSRDEESQLVMRARQGDGPARDRLVRAHLRYVVRVARRYRSAALPLDDLINEGNVGLLEAIERFDPDKGTRFITCADWWIRRAMINAVIRSASLVKISGQHWRAVREIRDATALLESRLGRPAFREEIGEQVSLNPASLDRLMQIKTTAVSLDDPAFSEDSNSTGIEHVASDDTHPDDALIREEDAQRLLDAVDRLTPRERLVIQQRHGIGGERRHSLKEIGARLSLSRERVRQIDAHARKRLRRLMARSAWVGTSRPHAAL